MSTVSRLDAAQLAGLQAVFFAPVAALLNLPDTDAGGLSLLGDLVLAAGFAWAQLQGTIYTPTLDVDATPGPHGPSFEHELAGFFAGDAPEVAAQFLAMQGRRFVLLYRDYTGQTRLVGDLRGGLEFSYKLASGSKPGERKGYKWSFKGRTAGPALFYTGVMPAALAPAPAPGEGGGTVEVYTSKGRFLGIAQAGQKVIITSPFRVTVKFE